MVIQNILKDSNGILYCSPKGTSEYADAGRRTVYDLFNKKIPVSWYNLSIDDTKNDEEDFVYHTIAGILNKNISFDTAIFHCTPDIWHDHIERYKIKFTKKKIIGYFSWETTSLPISWVRYINLIDEVWVTSNFNKEVLEKCGVDIPIKVVPHVFIDKPLPDINSNSLSSILMNCRWYGNEKNLFKYGEGWINYYTSGEWNELNNIEETVKTFCRAFTVEDKVRLLIRTFYKDYSKKNSIWCINKLESILKEYPLHPEILLYTSDLSSHDKLLLDSVSNFYFSMKRGGSICIDELNFFNRKKPVIISKFGDSIEYFGKSYGWFIGADVVNVNFPDKLEIYSSDQKWVDPDIKSGVDKLKESYLLPNKKVKSPLILKDGWFFKEKSSGNSYRYSSASCKVEFTDTGFDYAKFIIRYDYGHPTKDVEIILDSTIKKKVTLNKGVSKDVSVPSNRVRFIEFISKAERNSKTPADHRELGILLENVELIKGLDLISLSVDDIPVENELTDFHFISSDNKLENYIDTEISLLNTDKKVSLVKIEVNNYNEFSGILYIGQYGTSGYASAAKGNMCHFFTKGIPVSWIPLKFDNSELSDECFYNILVKSFINKPIEIYDSVFIHATADIWPLIGQQHREQTKGKKIIGYSVWETNQLPYEWVDNINECVDEVWVPSLFNKSVYKSSGIRIPIKVFPHVFLQKELPPKEYVLIKPYNSVIDKTEKNYYTFYNISELNPRKGIEDLVKVYCDAFTSKDKVRLILKVHYKDYKEDNKKYCIKILTDIVSRYKNPPRIHYILNNMTEREILGLHSIGDCYISLCKSEGFGLTIFEAYKYGKRVITTGYGGHLDFLGDEYDGLVKYTLGPIKGMEQVSKYYTKDQQWAYPNLEHAKELIKLCL